MPVNMTVKKLPDYKDEVIAPFLGNSPNATMSWLILAGYCACVLNKPIVSYNFFYRLKDAVVYQWDKITEATKQGFTLASIKNEDFTNTPDMLKKSAGMHVDIVYKNVNTDNYVTAEGKPNEPPVRVRIEAKVFIDTSNKELLEANRAQTKLIANECGFNSYTDGYLYWARGENRADISKKLYTFLVLLKEINITVNCYQVIEVLADSSVNDVWGIFKETNK